MLTNRSSGSVQAAAFAIACIVTFVIAAVGGFAAADARSFYAELSKPEWAPPGWLFGPVWMVLYSLMAIAAWLVWKAAGLPRAKAALVLYGVQLIANGLWSWLFFSWRLGAFAFVEIVVLWTLIVATFVAFLRIRRPAAFLLTPYLAWVAFATALTFATWQRNPALLG